MIYLDMEVSLKVAKQRTEAQVSPVNGSDEDAEKKPCEYMPNAKECALLLLLLIQSKEEETGKPVSRFRISELSLSHMWGRHRVSAEFIGDVNEWLLRAGRTLFHAGGYYGVILTSAVDGWSRLTSKRISSDIDKALNGLFVFKDIEELMKRERLPSEEDD